VTNEGHQNGDDGHHVDDQLGGQKADFVSMVNRRAGWASKLASAGHLVRVVIPIS